MKKLPGYSIDIIKKQLGTERVNLRHIGIMDSNSIKHIKKLFTEMFANHYKKICKMSHTHKKSLTEMTEQTIK